MAKMATVLAEADLPAAGGEGSGQAVFDSLNQAGPRNYEVLEPRTLGRVDDLARVPSLTEKFATEPPALTASPREEVERERRLSRQERGAVVESQTVDRDAAPAAKMSADAKADLRGRIFESEIDPFEFSVLASVLCGGLWLMYRLGLGQIKLARQQQDFVSAVSHELKTPLTSIRMYSEMLREGWAAERKKSECYAYIHDESERLSRLINNVLNLARMTRDELKVELKAVTVGELMDGVRSKVTTMVAQAGSELRLQCAPALSAAVIEVDQDCFTQIILNLVDNALKFSAQAATRTVEISCRADGARRWARHFTRTARQDF